MKNISSFFKKSFLPVLASSAIFIGGCGNENNSGDKKSISDFFKIKNPGETEFIEYKKRITFYPEDFKKSKEDGVYPSVCYDLETGKKLALNSDFFKRVASKDPNSPFSQIFGDIKSFLKKEGYDFSTYPYGGGSHDVIYPEYNSNSFTFFGKEYIRFDEKGNLLAGPILEKLPKLTFDDIRPLVKLVQSDKTKEDCLTFLVTDKFDYYILQNISCIGKPPKIEIDAYKLKNSKVSLYSPRNYSHLR